MTNTTKLLCMSNAHGTYVKIQIPTRYTDNSLGWEQMVVLPYNEETCLCQATVKSNSSYFRTAPCTKKATRVLVGARAHRDVNPWDTAEQFEVHVCGTHDIAAKREREIAKDAKATAERNRREQAQANEKDRLVAKVAELNELIGEEAFRVEYQSGGWHSVRVAKLDAILEALRS